MTSLWDEFGLIARQFRPLAAREAGAFNLTDDAAALTPTAGHDWVVTADALVAGVHFFPDDPAAAIAKKALRVNLSDLAAMGAKPRVLFMTCALPQSLEESWLIAFTESLGEDLEAYGLTLAGGDIVSTPGPLTLSMTLMGETPTGQVLRRNGALPGDIIAVTGNIGDAALGLDLQNGRAPLSLKDDDRSYLTYRYRVPTPQISAGLALNGVAHAGLDISDGLLGDLRHMAQASEADIAIDVSRVPLSPAVQNWISERPEDMDRVLSGGDDYELVFACAPEDFLNLAQKLADFSVPMTAIGRVEAGEGHVFKVEDGQRHVVGANGGHRHGLTN